MFLQLFLPLLLVSYCHGTELMGWMCLERCRENINADLQQIAKYKDVLTAVSFEAFDLGYNATLVNNSFTDVNPTLKALNLKRYPMITTVNLEKIRQLIKNPDGFIAHCIELAKIHDYTGYNVDFEPHDSATEEDAAGFAEFLTKFRNALNAHGFKLSVDIASWNSFWSFPHLSQSSVDTIITMDTYAGNFDTFLSRLQKAVQYFPLNRLGIGLETVNPNNGKPFTEQELKMRFDAMAQYKIQEIDIWQFPIPDLMWQFLKEFRSHL